MLQRRAGGFCGEISKNVDIALLQYAVTHPVEHVLKRAREAAGHRVGELGLHGLRDQFIVAEMI